jgi:hypothetical protein
MPIWAPPREAPSMKSSIITKQRFNTILAAIPNDGDAIGLDREGVYYIVKKEKSGERRGKPYTNPPRIQISDDHQRFWIERIDGQLRATYDPNGGFTQTSIDDGASLSTLEQYFEKLEGHLQIVAAKRRGAASPRSDLTMDDLQAFLRLLLPWCDEAQRSEVEHAVRSAVDAPQRYVRDHLDHLARRGIRHPTRHLHVIALVDALQAVGAAAEIDWNAGGKMIHSRASRLAAPYGISIDPVTGGSNCSTLEILRRIGRHLSTKGYDLATIDIDSDAYVLIVVPAPASREVKALAAKMDIEIHRP